MSSETDPAWAAAVLPNARRGVIETAAGPRPIYLSLPEGRAPAQGWPLIVVLDGDNLFATVAETVRRLANRPGKTFVGPAVVIGVGGAAGDAHEPGSRYRDFTFGPPSEPLPGPAQSENAFGGGPALMALLREQVAPLAREAVAVDAARRLLIGHSLGGRFVLEARQTEPALFSHWAAICPSLWWDETLVPQPGGPPVFIAIGEREETPERRMATRARTFAESLGGEATFYLAPDEDHASTFTVALPRLLRAFFAA